MSAQQSIAVYADNGKVSGRCSLWWRNTPFDPLHRIGLIGEFEARDQADATRLLGKATAALGAAGCTLALGPMDGDSWHSYRATTWSDGEPAFVMEPALEDKRAAFFARAGFSVHSCYLSAALAIDDVRVAFWHRMLAGLARWRYRIRNIDLENYDAELDRIHRFCCRSFRGNHLYSPIDAQSFHALYAPLKPMIQPEFVYIAEQAGEMIGLLFAIPDLNQSLRGEAVDTLVWKTLAIAPEMRGRGIGFLLMYQSYQAARAAGYRRIIHALMHQDNRSFYCSLRNRVRVIREYALFAREIPG
jgi:GNAT superfamily N-acetyltransferase